MALTEERFADIDAEVESAGFKYSPFRAAFLFAGGDDSDTREAEEVRESLGMDSEVGEEELPNTSAESKRRPTR